MFTFQGAKYINLYSLIILKNSLKLKSSFLKIDLLNKLEKKFASNLISWYSVNKRSLPWRETTDSYKIWLSEIILQQTQIKQGLSYYNKFVKLYPNVTALSKASEQDILKNWEGLGYYSRARNLHKSAKIVVDKYESKFPSNYDELIKLPGIGDYSASAISSFSNNEVRPVLDGNVYRFVGRMFQISTTINTPSAVKVFKNILNLLISKNNPSDFNQAIMDFGSTVCKPKNPNCDACIFKLDCLSFIHNTIEKYPVKKKPPKSKSRILDYLVVIDKKRMTLINKRNEKDIWQNLFDFPLIETTSKVNKAKIKTFLSTNYESISLFDDIFLHKSIMHKLSHQNLKINFWIVKVSNPLIGGVDLNNLKNYPFPKPLISFISSINKLLL